MKRPHYNVLLFILMIPMNQLFSSIPILDRWTESRAADWYQRHPWIVGCNFIPSTAVNQIEMWQSETFDTATIERELRWASDLGLNTVRVYLHDIPRAIDREGFLERVDRFLDLAGRQKIMVVFVLLDDCWNTDPKGGAQPAPVPGVHNSAWVQCPGTRVVTEPALWPLVEVYVKDVLRVFAADGRVLMWDLYNEPGNSAHGKRALPLLHKVFEWAREIGPSQPVTAGVYDGCDDDIEAYILKASDILTFHSYEDVDRLGARIGALQKERRPLICTEWMARTRGSTIRSHLPVFKEKKVGALFWGFVAGKTQTIFPWGSKEGSSSPQVWFHDLLTREGKPFDAEEAAVIRRLTGKIPPR